MQYHDLITFYDLTKFTKSQLIDIATDMSLKEASNSYRLLDIASAIYTEAKSNVKSAKILESRKNILFARGGSVSWYRVKDAESNDSHVLIDFVTYLKEEDASKPFNESKLNDSNLNNNFTSTVPILLGAIDGGDEILLRYAIKSGIRTSVNAFQTTEVPKIEIVTVVVSPKQDLLEIRASIKSASKVYKSIVSFIKDKICKTVESKQFSFKDEFGVDPVTALASKIGGTVIENVDIPSKIYEEMSEEEKDSVAQILIAINNRLNDTDGTSDSDVNVAIDDARGILADNFAGVPFTELILNGLTKVDLSSLKELQNTPLYSTLSNHLITKTSHIRFPFTTEGSTDTITIKVGLTTNTVVFPASSSEDALRTVRRVFD